MALQDLQHFPHGPDTTSEGHRDASDGDSGRRQRDGFHDGRRRDAQHGRLPTNEHRCETLRFALECPLYLVNFFERQRCILERYSRQHHDTTAGVEDEHSALFRAGRSFNPSAPAWLVLTTVGRTSSPAAQDQGKGRTTKLRKSLSPAMEPPKRPAPTGEGAPSERAPQRPRLDDAPPSPPQSEQQVLLAREIPNLCELLITLLGAGTPLEECMQVSERGVVLGHAVPFFLIASPGIVLEQRLGLLRRLLEAGLPATHSVLLSRLTRSERDAAMDLLSIACLTGHPETARLLYSFGARIATARLTPGGPLQLLIMCKRDTNLIRLALELGFDPNQDIGDGDRVITPLSFAVTFDLPLDIVCSIVKLGPKDAENVYGYTVSAKPVRTDVLLHFAFVPPTRNLPPPASLYCALRSVIAQGNLELVQLLVNAAKEHGRTDWKQNRQLLMHAIHSTKLSIVQYLLDEGLEKQDFSLLDFPFRDANVDILEFFLDSGMPLPNLLDTEIEVEDDQYEDSPDVSPLIYVAQNGSPAALRALLRRGVHKIEAQLWSERDGSRRHVLHFAAMCTSGDPFGCVQELLDVGMHPDVLDHKKRSALHYAAKRGNDDAIYALVEAGASPLQDMYGLLPVDLLFWGPGEDNDSLSLLTELCYMHKLE